MTVVEIYKPDIIGITEVKPKNPRYVIQECELAIDNFDVFHNLGNEGRGVALYVHNKLKPSLYTDIKNEFEEKIFVECKVADGGILLVGLIYRCQSDQHEEETAKRLNELFELVSKEKATHKLIMGDFNFPQLDWEREMSKASENHIASKFLEATKDNFFYQHQKTATRYRKGQNANTLDLIFTNIQEMMVDLKVEAGLGKSDHMCLVMELSVAANRENMQQRRNFRKMNVEKLKRDLGQYAWQDDLEDLNVNDAWTLIKERVDKAIHESVPISRSKGKKGKKYITKDTLDSVRNKHRLYRKWKRTGNPDDEIAYNRANTKSRKECRKAKKDYEKKVAKSAKENPKLFYSYVNSQTKCRTGIADLRCSYSHFFGHFQD